MVLNGDSPFSFNDRKSNFSQKISYLRKAIIAKTDQGLILLSFFCLYLKFVDLKINDLFLMNIIMNLNRISIFYSINQSLVNILIANLKNYFFLSKFI